MISFLDAIACVISRTTHALDVITSISRYDRRSNLLFFYWSMRKLNVTGSGIVWTHCGYLPCSSSAEWETKRYCEDSRSYQALTREWVAFVHQDLWCHHESLLPLLISGGAQPCGKRSDTYHTLRASNLSHSRLLFRTCSSLWRRNTPTYIFSKARGCGFACVS